MKLMTIRDALLRNCILMQNDDGTTSTIEKGVLGDIIIRHSNGTVSRVEKSANGVDLIIRHPNGSYDRMVL